MKKHYGARFRILHCCTDQLMTEALAKMDLTSSQGRIMSYIARQSQPPCSRDIEEFFHLSHPSVSGTLSRLEKKGFIEFRPAPEDHRFKRIYILPKGKECHDRMHQTILHNEERLVQGFTEEEKQLFADFLLRAIENMGGSPCQRKHKEEDKQ